MKTIELLSPAKDLECGIEAINHGADAVYIGAEMFSARSAAGNSLKDIATLVSYAHVFYVKVYVAINTILYDNEIQNAVDLIYDLHKINVDAVIIQDVGILEFDLPPIQIHASTQLNNRSLEKVKFLEDVGFSQIVLARELNLSQIKEICDNVKTPIEFFIHGALCVAYSGQCYMSEYATSRSGNRGTCSQMCRHEYSLTGIDGHENEKGHFLSLKDFHSANHLAKMVDAGVSSFKIEGRLKDVHYVKNTTAYYRKKLDEIIATRNDLQKASHGNVVHLFNADIHKSFAREFTSYFLPEDRQKVVNVKSPKAIGEYIGRVSEQKGKTITINTAEKLSNGDGLCYYIGIELVGFRVNVAQGNTIQTTDYIELLPGTKLWRNYDISFSKQMDQNSSERKIPISISFVEVDNGFSVEIKDEYGVQVQLKKECAKELAKNADKVIPTIQKQFSKLGDTPCEATNVSVSIQTPFFLPISFLNEIRRECIELYLAERNRMYSNKVISIQKNNVQYPVNEPQDCRLNASNSYAKQFYNRHGVENIQDAFEINKNQDVPLMTTKHCIRFQLDSCPKINKKIQRAEPAFLEDKTGKYRVEFDCAKCEMNIFPA